MLETVVSSSSNTCWLSYAVRQILTDEEFRSDFLEQPFETLRSLRDRGFELTTVEIDALGHTDCGFWTVGAEWIDGRLQRCRLVGGKRK